MAKNKHNGGGAPGGKPGGRPRRKKKDPTTVRALSSRKIKEKVVGLAKIAMPGPAGAKRIAAGIVNPVSSPHLRLVGESDSGPTSVIDLHLVVTKVDNSFVGNYPGGVPCSNAVSMPNR